MVFPLEPAARLVFNCEVSADPEFLSGPQAQAHYVIGSGVQTVVTYGVERLFCSIFISCEVRKRFLYPEGGSQKATLVVLLLVVVISFLSVQKCLRLS